MTRDPYRHSRGIGCSWMLILALAAMAVVGALVAAGWV